MEKIKEFKDQFPNWSAAIVLAGFVILFLLPSILTNSYFIHTSIFSPNYLDATGQIMPWFKLSGEILRGGHFPLWNDLTGMGLPLFANMQSAILFPLSWLFYFFPMKLALGMFIFAKFFIFGFFTYLFLRRLRLGFWPSLIAAVSAMFSGALMIWPQWTLSNVVMLLPVFFFLVQRAFETKRLIFALWFAPLTALGIIAGHPQTFFYVFFSVCCYAAFCLLTDIRNFQSWKMAGYLIIATVLGVGLSAPALLPFLEYLKLSANLDYRAGFALNPFSLTKNLFISNLIPDFFGNPGYKNFDYLPVPNYSEITMGYVGLAALLLAVYGSWQKHLAKIQWFFLGLAVLCFCLIYRVEPIYLIFNKLPGFDWDYNNRLLYVWAFCLPVLAAFGLEDILKRGPGKKLFLIMLGTAAVSIGLLLLNRQPGLFAAAAIPWSRITKWQLAFTAVFSLQLLAAGALVYYAAKRPGRVWLLAVFVFLETGVHGLILNRTTSDGNFYPQTPVIKFLSNDYQKEYGRTFVYGHAFLPNIATWYGFNELSDYDVMYLKSNKQLKQSIANYNYSPEYTFDQPNLAALRFFGARWLLYPKGGADNLVKQNSADLSVELADEHYELVRLNNVFPRAFTVKADNLTDLQNILSGLEKGQNLNLMSPVAGFTVLPDGQENIVYNAPAGSFLVTTDNYYPDWFAQIGAQTLPVGDAMGLRAVAVPTGEHQLQIVYQPKSFRLGWEISLAALIAWSGLMIFSARRKTPNLV